MKKVFIICFLICANLFAQAEILPFHLGVYVGAGPTINSSSFKINTNKPQEVYNTVDQTSVSATVGIFARIKIKKFYIQPELAYSWRNGKADLGVEQSAGAANITYGVTFRNNSIDVPVLFGFVLADMKIVNIRVYAGPIFSHANNSAASFNNLPNGSQLADQISKTPLEFKANYWSVMGGVGVDVWKVTFDLRISTSLENTTSNPDFANIKSGLVALCIGFKII